jgi:hypothetical protein
MKIKKPLALGLVSGLALTAFSAAVPAFADPVSNSYVAVGSDTLQDSMNALTNGTKVTGATVRITAGGSPVGNFDAFGSATIQTKSTGPFFTRPSGSGDGISALSASIKGASGGFKGTAITNQVDIARSSSGPGGNANAAGLLAYVPYARDAVAYVYYPDPAHPTDLADIDATTLKQIYASDAPVTLGSTVVKPLIPQPASGTRKFFLSAIGASTNATCGLTSCATTGSNVSVIPENDASQLTEVGQIIPFSIANWIAQSNGAAPSTISGTTTVKVGTPTGVTPYSGTAPALVPDATYYANTTWGRDTFLVVEYARIDSSSATYDSVLAGLVNSTSTASLTNFTASLPSQPGSVKKKFGFLAPSSTTVQRAYTTLP